MDDLDLGCVADLLLVLDEGSYRRAAARRQLSPSALSRRIRRLERQVGVPLLLRGPAGTVGATAAGLAFAAGAGPLLEAARTARELARAAVPVVRLGIPGGRPSLPGWLSWTDVRRRFQTRVPGVGLRLVGMPFAAMYDALVDGSVDVLWGAMGATPASLALVPGGATHRIVIVPPRHRLADADRVTVTDVVDLPLQANPTIPAGWMAPWLLGDVRPVRQARIVETAAVTSPQVLQQTLRGDAIAVVADWLAPVLPPGVRGLPLEDLPPYPHWIARRRDDRRGPVLALSDIVSAAAPNPGTGLS